jgi:hypothetical protein
MIFMFDDIGFIFSQRSFLPNNSGRIFNKYRS